MKGGGEEEKEGNKGRWGRERAMFTKAEFQLTVDPSTWLITTLSSYFAPYYSKRPSYAPLPLPFPSFLPPPTTTATSPSFINIFQYMLHNTQHLFHMVLNYTRFQQLLITAHKFRFNAHLFLGKKCDGGNLSHVFTYVRCSETSRIIMQRENRNLSRRTENWLWKMLRI